MRAHRFDAAWTAELADADIVLVAAPVGQYAEAFQRDRFASRRCARRHRRRAAQRATSSPRRAPHSVHESRASFPGIPIAGSDRSGARNAAADLFEGRNVVLTPDAGDGAGRDSRAWPRCGRAAARACARCRRTITIASSRRYRTCRISRRSRSSRTWPRAPDAATLLALAGAAFAISRGLRRARRRCGATSSLANRDALRDGDRAIPRCARRCRPPTRVGRRRCAGGAVRARRDGAPPVGGVAAGRRRRRVNLTMTQRRFRPR